MEAENLAIKKLLLLQQWVWRWEERELINIAVRVEVGGEGIN